MAESLTSIADDLIEAEQNAGGDKSSVGDILDAFENRSIGVLITLLGLIAALPIIGAIPGVSIGTGLLILVAAGRQLMVGGGVWAPDKLREVSFEDSKVEKAVDKSRPFLRYVDKLVKPRLDWAVNRTLTLVCVMLLALSFLPLAFVPFGVQAPAIGVILFGVSLIGRDGVFSVMGYALMAVTVWVMFSML